MPDDTDAIAQLQASCPELFSQNVEDFDDESRPVKRLRTERDRAPRAPRPRPAKPAEPKAKPKAAAEAKSVAGFYSKAAVVEAPEPAELVLPELEASDDEDDVADTYNDEDDDEAAPNMDLDDIVFTEEPQAQQSTAPALTAEAPPSATVAQQPKHQPPAAPTAQPPRPTTAVPQPPPRAAATDTGHSPGAYTMPLANSAQVPAASATAGPSSSADRTLMYWIDAKEDNFSSPGVVYMFGKTWDAKAGWKSCCLRVNNISRCIFVLPRAEKLGPDGAPISGAEPTLVEVVEELGRTMAQHNIPQRRMKAVDRWYAFEAPGVPRERTKWIKVRYPASSPALNITDCSKYKTFSHVFGATRSFLELLLLKRRLKGPSWISIQGAVAVPPESQITWASIEWSVDTPKAVTVIPDSQHPPPPLTILSLNMLTFLNEKQKVNEIAAVTCIVNSNVTMDGRPDDRAVRKWTAVRRLGDSVFPFDMDKVFKAKRCPEPRKEQSEKAMLTNLMSEIEAIDPDMIVGHNFMGFDLDVLLHRLQAHSVGNWSRIGKMKLRQMPRLQAGAGGMGEATWEERAVLNGRLVADTYLLSREYLKESSYKLLRLAMAQGLEGPSGKITEAMVEEEPLLDPVKELATAEGIFKLVHWCDTKAVLALGLMYKMSIIPLTKRLTSLAGNLWSRTLTGSRAERIEFLLLHRFHAQKFVVPDKAKRWDQPKGNEEDQEGGRTAGGRGKPKYAGGKVLDPKRGLYTDYVLLLDFNSLYPSIIQEYNVCFTTVERTELLADGTYSEPPVPTESVLVCDSCKALQARAAEDPDAPKVVLQGQSCLHRCILPKAIKELVDSRKQVKKLLKDEKDPHKQEVLDIRQKALKLTANSIYGCLGFQSSRFYAQVIAQLVTSKGREALTSTVEIVPKIDQSLDVVYGDTDSVMVSTGMTGPDVGPAIRMANLIKKEVNKLYRCLEIDIDGIFKSILLVRKKKYAAVTLKDISKGDRPDNLKHEVKGLDLVRRDWCPLSQRASGTVLDFILSGRPADEILDSIHGFLADLADRVRNGKVELRDYVITKSLTKAPEQYADKASQPHVQVALRMREHKLSVQTNDFIPYVICESESIQPEALGLSVNWDKSKLANKAFHSDEVKNAALGLRPDLEWYLATQLHPPVTRLCEHIQGMDSHYIAEILGLQSSKYIVHTTTGGPSEPVAAYRYTTHNYDMDDEVRFEDCEQLRFVCTGCDNEIDLSVKQRLFDELQNLFVAGCDFTACRALNFFTCPKCFVPVPVAKVYNTLLLKIRSHQQQYYSQCTRLSTHPTKDQGHYSYTDQKLRHQLTYYCTLFDFPSAKDQVWNKLETKVLGPLKKQEQMQVVRHHEERLRKLFDGTVDKTLPANLEEDTCRLRGAERRQAQQLKDNLDALVRLVRVRLQACKRHYVSVDSLFENLGLQLSSDIKME